MENNEFKFTYSAKEQAEIQRIRNKYAAPSENKLEELRRLDNSVTQKANVLSLVVGILGALVLGGGMSLVMVAGGIWTIPGILLGVGGMVLVALAYPVYMKTVEKERVRIAPRILQLTDELTK